MKKYLFLDIETTGLKELDDKIHGIAVMHGEDEEPQYLPMWDLPEWFIKELADPNVIKVIHSGKRFDLIFLQRAGLEINGPIHDTLFIYKSINENMPLGLKQLTEKYRGKEYLKSKRALNQACDKAGVKNVAGLCRMDLKDAEHEHFDIIAKYAVEDVENTCFLYFKGKELLNKTWNSIKKMYGDKGQSPAQLLAKSVFPIDSVQLKIDKRGVKANMDLLNQIRKEKEIERDRLRSQMYELHKDYVDQWEEDAYQRVVAGRASDRGKKSVKRHHKASNYCTLFNWDSSKHVAPLVYKHLNVPEQFHKFTEKTGELTLDKNAVNEMLTGLLPGHKAIKFLKLYKEYKKVHKIASTYTGNAKTGLFSKIRNGRLWTKYYQTPRTWRWASSGPNLQNIPRAGVTQEFFVPDTDNHVFFVADYTQIELMVAAHRSQDPKLLEAFRLGEDLHAKTARAMLMKEPGEVLTDEERQIGKTANFLLIYRGNWKKLMFQLKEDTGREYTEGQCRNFVERFFEEYSVLDQYLQQLEADLRRKHHIYIPETGGIRRVPDIVYLDHLDWKNYKFTGPAELAARAIEECKDDWTKKARARKDYSPAPMPSDKEIFWKCYEYGRKAKNQGINFPGQHIAGYIINQVMIELVGAGYDLVNQVHDELKIQLHKSNLDFAPRIQYYMENTYKISVPLVAEWEFRSSFSKSAKLDLDITSKS